MPVVVAEPINSPDEAEKFTVCPDNTELPEANTVAVMVVEVEPSLFTLVLVVARSIDAADDGVTPAVPGPVVPAVAGAPLPPQPTNRAAIAASIKAVKVLACFE